MAACLFNNVAMAFGCQQIGFYESTGEKRCWCPFGGRPIICLSLQSAEEIDSFVKCRVQCSDDLNPHIVLKLSEIDLSIRLMYSTIGRQVVPCGPDDQ